MSKRAVDGAAEASQGRRSRSASASSAERERAASAVGAATLGGYSRNAKPPNIFFTVNVLRFY